MGQAAISTCPAPRGITSIVNESFAPRVMLGSGDRRSSEFPLVKLNVIFTGLDSESLLKILFNINGHRDILDFGIMIDDNW